MAQGHERLADVKAMVRLMEPLHGLGPDPAQGRRRLVADLCRLIGRQMGALPPEDADARGPANTAAAGRSTAAPGRPLPSTGDLSPRERQTLERLLDGDSEKQIAARLKLSRHTVHVYVKRLYRRFDVSSRAELLALWVRT